MTTACHCRETDRDYILLPRDFEGRDTLIRHFVGVLGWRRAKVADLFGMSVRQVRRITRPELLDADVPEPDDSSTLTHDQMKQMARDWAADPDASTEDKEAAAEFIARGCPRSYA